MIFLGRSGISWAYGYSEGIKVDPKKMEAVKNCLKPLTPLDIRSFLGLSLYYRRSIGGFSSMSSPLKKIFSQKNAKFVWTDEFEKSFQIVKY